MSGALDPDALSAPARPRRSVLARVMSGMATSTEDFELTASILRRRVVVSLVGLAPEDDGLHVLALCTAHGGAHDGMTLMAWLPMRNGGGEEIGSFLSHFVFQEGSIHDSPIGIRIDPEAVAPATDDEVAAWAAANDEGPPHGPAFEVGWAGERLA